MIECLSICCFPGCTEPCYRFDHDKGKHVCHQHKADEFKPETRIRVTLTVHQPESNDLTLTKIIPLTATLSADNEANIERAVSQMICSVFAHKNIQTGL